MNSTVSEGKPTEVEEARQLAPSTGLGPGSVQMASLLMTDFLRQAGGAAIIDGGLATELERHGADLNDPLWSAKSLLTSPQLIRNVISSLSPPWAACTCARRYVHIYYCVFTFVCVCF